MRWHLVIGLAVLSIIESHLPGIEFRDNGGRKYVTEENGVAITTTRISPQLTFCSWVYPKWARWFRSHGVFHIKTTETPTNEKYVSVDLSYDDQGSLLIRSTEVHTFHFVQSIDFANILRKWNRLCVSYDFDRNEAQMSFSGSVSDLIKDPVTSPNMNGSFDAKLLSGAGEGAELVLTVGRYFFDHNPLIGTLAGINMWDRSHTATLMVTLMTLSRTMSAAELREMTSCSEINTAQGNLVNSSTTWELTGSLVALINVSLDDLKCHKQVEKINAFLPVAELTMQDAIDLCGKFGEDVPVAGEFLNKADFDHYYEGLYKNQHYVEWSTYFDNGRLMTWLPYRRNGDSSALVHYTTGERLLGGQEDKYYAYWYSGPQQSNESNQCALAYFGLVRKYENIWESSCSRKMFTACEIKNSLVRTSKLVMRGLCKYSLFDTTYVVTYSHDTVISYLGVERTIISYNFTESLWTMRDVTNPDVLAVTKADFRSLAIGNNNWTVTNDYLCGEGSQRKMLSLTSCHSNQFTCNDGLCVDLQLRCDGKTDCKDSSDELQCRVIEIDPSYNKFLSPPSREKLPVMISLRLHSISRLDPILSSYRAEFTVILSWRDSRLVYNNLRAESSMNYIRPEETQQIWFPDFYFDNTQKKIKSSIDALSALRVVRNGSGVLSSNQETENKLIFTGKENFMEYERFYSEEFHCEFYLHWYPFDQQRCFIDIKPAANNQHLVSLLADTFEYSGPVDLKVYEVRRTELRSEGRGVVRVEIVIQRRLLSITLTTFLPTILINITGHMSNYFNRDFFEGLMAMNVTLMLVLTTLFVSVSTNLTSTAYIKMIDCWLIFSLFKPFVDIILQTYIQTFRDVSEDRDVKGKAWIKKEKCVEIKLSLIFLRVIYPVFFIVFVVIFWMVGLSHYIKL